MADLHEKLKGASDRVAPRWDDDRARRVQLGMLGRQRQRARVKRVAAGAALSFALLVTFVIGSGGLAEAASAVRRFFAFVTGPTTEQTVETAPAATTLPPARATGKGNLQAASAPESPGEIPNDQPIAPESAVVPTASAPVKGTAPNATAPAKANDWRALAREQNFSGAYDALKGTKGESAVKDEPQDLLLMSDVARLSKHPEEAVSPLQRVVRDHRTDARAPLAAFTLGRVLLDLKRPAEAADAFAEARSLAPNGSIAEDALAREVEAAANAGDTERARARAEEYVTRYPEGVRIGTVKRLGGLR